MRMFIASVMLFALPAFASSAQGDLQTALSEGNWLLALALVAGAGFLTALSPCVYPLIPVTLSILGTRKAQSPLQGFLLASAYVLGMVVLYTVLGVSFAALGVVAGSALQSPWVTIGVALFCIIMAASMFGAFEFALPAGLQNKLSQIGGGGYGGAFAMGLVAGIIAAPCTGPVLSFILTLIARDGNIPKGAVLMIVYALGMGVPFLVLGTFSQALARVPKSGAWMEVVKSVFGVLMLAAATYYLAVGLPAVAHALRPLQGVGVWLGPVLVVLGIVVGALHLSFKDSPLTHKIRKGVGVIAVELGVVALIAWSGQSGSSTITWRGIGAATPDAVAIFDAALAEAKAAGKPVMIDFGAEWCVACKELDKLTYVDASVQTEANRFVNIKIDATDDSPALETIQTRFGVVGLPTVAFITSAGVRSDETVTGFLGASEYAAMMRRVH
jgi:thioredoxin:protein disulfide reductase